MLTFQEYYSQIYEKILLKENPDKTINPVTKKQLSSEVPNCLPFGFLDISNNSKTIISKDWSGNQRKVTLSNFGPEWKNRCYVGEEQSLHASIMYQAVEDIFNSSVGLVQIENLNREGKGSKDVLNLAMPNEVKKFKTFVIDWFVEPRDFLSPTGRIWLNEKIISLWCKEENFNKEYLLALLDFLKIKEPSQYYIEFLGDVQPQQTAQDFLNGSKKVNYSEEEQEQRNKKAAEDYAIVHLAASSKTTDQNSQNILRKRKKAVSNIESKLRTQNIRPSLATKQQSMTSESKKN